MNEVKEKTPYNKTLYCLELMHQYFSKESVNSLAKIEYPSSLKYGSEKWLIYVFYSCLLDYGMRSKLYHQNLIYTYNKYPNIFNPKYIVEYFQSENEEQLLSIIKDNIHPRYPNVALQKWLHLSCELSKYKSLIDKVKEFESFEELNTFIKNIKGYGQKTGGLLLRAIQEANICNFNEEMNTIPLDRHDIEISFLNEIISCKQLSQKQIENLSTLWIKCGKELGISPILVDKYLWEIGNQFCNGKKCMFCPLKSTCKTKMREE